MELIIIIIILAAQYFIIKYAVKHGVMDAYYEIRPLKTILAEPADKQDSSSPKKETD